MLTHEERYQLARDLCTRMVAQYPDQVIIGGVYGSTARGSDTPWSDLEMWFVVSDDCPAKGQHFTYRDTAAGYRVYRQKELEEIIITPTERWPFHMGVLSVLQVLHGDTAHVRAWIEMGMAVPKSRFHATLAEILPGLVVESYGRIHSSQARGDKRNAIPAVWEVLDEMLTTLCLLNQRWVTHDYYQGLVDSFSFPKLPAEYQEIVPTLYDANDFTVIVPLADRLVTNFQRLLSEEGIPINNYQTVENIPL